MTLVVDASALVRAAIGTSAQARALRRRLGTQECHAPHLIDAELGNVLRRRVARGELPEPAAREILAVAPVLVDHRHDMSGPLAATAWRLRDNLTFYDGLYVALAAALDCPLVTADLRLSRAPDLPCAVETVP